MNTPAVTLSKPPPPPRLDLAALKTRQQAAWSSATMRGRHDAADRRRGTVRGARCSRRQKVLDVAAGTAMPRSQRHARWCDVTATDYVPRLLERARERAGADHFDIAFREADAEALPFEDGSFDAVLSTFGVMFTPNQERAAAEMARVCKRGGKIGLANWTPAGFIGQLFKTIGKHMPRRRA